ncbi:MAG TPA: permease, partial [Burkholderiales bacterium]|nr:permease [Burkholderiales bacterium]
MDWVASISPLVQGGFGNLAAYLAAHVLLCLLPAFFIAGAMTALIPKPSITRFLGRNTRKSVSYPAAAAAGSLLAVCSCTIVPIFAGIYRKGAGIGPAITFLFFAPAANILALVYTGGIIGPDLAFARFFLSLAFGIGIGLLMAMIFRSEDAAHDRATDALFAAQDANGMSRAALAFLAVWVVLLLAGTLKLGFLTDAHFSLLAPLAGVDGLQSRLDSLVPYDAAKGEEGVSVHGLALLALLAAIALAAWRGLERVHDGFNRWTWSALALIALTLLVASLSVETSPIGLRIGFTGKFFGVLATLGLLATLARRLTPDELRDWLWESWRFVKQIFPLLVAGVFLVGVIRVLIRPEWIQALACENTILANLAGVAFGVFMYFPTLVEVPIAKI